MSRRWTAPPPCSPPMRGGAHPCVPAPPWRPPGGLAAAPPTGRPVAARGAPRVSCRETFVASCEAPHLVSLRHPPLPLRPPLGFAVRLALSLLHLILRLLAQLLLRVLGQASGRRLLSGGGLYIVAGATVAVGVAVGGGRQLCNSGVHLRATRPETDSARYLCCQADVWQLACTLAARAAGPRPSLEAVRSPPPAVPVDAAAPSCVLEGERTCAALVV